MILSRLALAALLALALPLAAQTPADRAVAEVSVDRLAEVMQLDALFDVLRDEGLAYGKTLEADMFPSGGGNEWTAAVSGIYDHATLRTAFDAALEEALGSDPETLGEIVAFFGSDLGQRIVGLEIEARRAFLDEAA